MSRFSILAAAVLLFLASPGSAQTLTLTDAGKHADRRITIDGPHYTLVINPSFGGRIDRFVAKPSGVDLTRAAVKDKQGGLLADGVWQQSFWHGDWNDAPYSAEVVANTPQHVAVKLACKGDRWEDLTISKTIHARADSPQVRVEYAMTAGPLIHDRAKPDFHFTQATASRGRVFAVSPTGVREMTHRAQDETWVFEPTRDWIAWVPSGSGPGLAVRTDFAHLRFIRATHGEVDSLEFVLRKTHMKPGVPFTTTLTLEAIENVSSLVDAGAKGPVVAPMSAQRVEVGDSPTWSRYNPKDMDFSSTAVATPHRVWAKPYAAGRPRVLALLPAHQERQAVELAQRFDMDLTCTFLGQSVSGQVSTYYILGDRVRSLKIEEMHAHLDMVLARDYDVILTGYYSGWAELPAAARQKVLEKVKAGTGLVLTARGDAPDELKEYMPFDFEGYDRAHGKLLANPNASLPLANALPFSALPKNQRSNGAKMKSGMEDRMLVYNDGHGRYPYVCWTTIGEGRATISTLGTPLLPTAFKQLDPPAFDYHEYQMALIARLLYWAAGKDSPVSLLAVEPSASAVKVTVTADAAQKATIELTLRDEFGDVVSTRTIDQPLTAGESTFSIAPDRGGIERCLLADVIIRNDKGTLAWGAGVFPKASETTFATFKLDKQHYGPDENVKVDISFNGLVPLESSVRLSLYDGSGRLVEKKEVDGFSNISAELPLSRVIGPWFQLRGEYLMNGVVVDQTFIEGVTTGRYDPRRIHTSFWSWGLSGPDFLIEEGFKQFIKSGMNSNFSGRDPNQVRSMNRLNMPYSVQAVGLYANKGTTKAQRAEPQDPNKPLPVYVPSDPEALKKQYDAGRAAGERSRHINALMYSLGDENRGPPKDIGFSDVALKSFREWLRDMAYASLADLNVEWRTDFAAWDAVMPMTEAEIKVHGEKTGSYAAWADHRMYIKWAYAQYGKAATDGVLAAVPHAVVGPSGDQNSAAYGGRDWWHHARAFNGMAGYSGAQVMETQSFNPSMIYRPWAGYSKPNPLVRAQLWQALKLNSHGFHIFSATNHIHPDYTLPECGRDLRAAMIDIMRGPGQLLCDATMSHDGVYVLQSPQSIHAAYITGRDTDREQSRDGVDGMLSDLAVGFRIISYEQLAKGMLAAVKARVLVLPCMLAMSDAEVEAVRAFVSAGGLVIADEAPATFTGHAAKRGSSALADLIGNNRYVLLGEPMFAEYLNLRTDLMSAKAQQRSDVLQQRMIDLLASAGVKPAIVTRNRPGAGGADGALTHWLWYGVKDHGPIRYSMIVRDYTTIQFDAPDQPATVAFDRTAHIYDVLDGVYLGHTDRVELTLVNNTVRLYALLPYKVGTLSLDAPADWRAGRTLSATAQLAGAEADHLMRLEVIDPTGKARGEYADNLRAPAGKVAVTIPFAHNDPPGSWRLILTDVATGTETQATVTLR